MHQLWALRQPQRSARLTARSVVGSTQLSQVSLASARISILASKARREGMNPVAIQSLSMIAYLVPLAGAEAGG